MLRGLGPDLTAGGRWSEVACAIFYSEILGSKKEGARFAGGVEVGVGAAGEQSGAGGFAAAAGGAGRQAEEDEGSGKEGASAGVPTARRPDASFTCLAFAGQTHGSGKETGGGR